MPRAAALRKMAPTLVGFMTFSSTATRRQAARISFGSGCLGRSMAQSIPRVSWKPVSWVRMGISAVYTGTSPHRAMAAWASSLQWLRSTSRETGLHPASSARQITLGLSAMNIPFLGSKRFNSWASVSRAYTSSSGALKSVISVNSIMVFLHMFLFSAAPLSSAALPLLYRSGNWLSNREPLIQAARAGDEGFCLRRKF